MSTDQANSVVMTIKDSAAVLERVITTGDLKDLTPIERVKYYRSVCESLGLNPLTRPFEYLNLSGKLTLYARKDATEQLRTKRGISITKLLHEVSEGMYIVTASARDAHGREDSDLGVVPIDNLRGEARANAIMKATTKSKRRVTLSICGLGMLDESEVDSIQGARRMAVDMETGEILEREEPTPNSSYTYKDARGVSPSLSGISAEEAIRRGRGDMGGASPIEDAGREETANHRPEPPTAAPPSPADEESETLRSILLGDISKLADRLKLDNDRRKFHWVRLIGGQISRADATMEQLKLVHDGLEEMLTEGKKERRGRSDGQSDKEPRGGL